MSFIRDLTKALLVVAAVLFSFSTYAAAQACCGSDKAKSTSASAACESGKSVQASSAKTDSRIDSEVLKTIYTAASSGDFTAVQACPVTRSALKELSESNEHTWSMVQAAEKSNDYSKVAACKVTRGEINQAVLSYALNQSGVSNDGLNLLEQAAATGDFTKVAACKDTQALLKKVISATSDFDPECRDKVIQVVEGTADYSLVATCQQTRAEIDRAVKAYKSNLLKTSMLN